jgi:hypothetical protein
MPRTETQRQCPCGGDAEYHRKAEERFRANKILRDDELFICLNGASVVQLTDVDPNTGQRTPFRLSDDD